MKKTYLFRTAIVTMFVILVAFSIKNISESKDADFYIYLLDEGYSTEVKMRVVDQKTGETLDEEEFDLRQYQSYDAFLNSAEENGELVAVNRRLWNYTYIK